MKETCPVGGVMKEVCLVMARTPWERHRYICLCGGVLPPDWHVYPSHMFRSPVCRRPFVAYFSFVRCFLVASFVLDSLLLTL